MTTNLVSCHDFHLRVQLHVLTLQFMTHVGKRHKLSTAGDKATCSAPLEGNVDVSVRLEAELQQLQQVRAFLSWCVSPKSEATASDVLTAIAKALEEVPFVLRLPVSKLLLKEFEKHGYDKDTASFLCAIDVFIVRQLSHEVKESSKDVMPETAAAVLLAGKAPVVRTKAGTKEQLMKPAPLKAGRKSAAVALDNHVSPDPGAATGMFTSIRFGCIHGN